MRRAAISAAAAALALAAAPAMAGTWDATNSLEITYTGESTSEVAEARLGNSGGGEALLYEWPAPGEVCGELSADGRCVRRGGHYIPSRFVADLGPGDDVFSVHGPAPLPASRLNGIRYDGGPDRDMIYSRLDRSETQLIGQYGLTNGGTGDDMLDMRDAEGSSNDCGPGEDTAYLDAFGTTEHDTPETWQNCEHVVLGPDPLASVRVKLALPANGLTGDQAPLIEELAAEPEPGATLGQGRFECRLTHQFWRSCTAGERVAAPGDGAKSLLVRWIAPDGTIGDVLGQVTWRVDTTPPVTPVVSRRSYTAGGRVQERVTFGAYERVEGFECEVDGTGYVPCVSPLLLHDPGPGAHSVDVRSIDDAGNRSAAVGVRWSVAAPRPAPLREAGASGATKPPVFALRSVRAARTSRGARLRAACRYDGRPIACTVRWRRGKRTLASDRTGADGAALANLARRHLRRGRTIVLTLDATARRAGGGSLRATATVRIAVPKR